MAIARIAAAVYGLLMAAVAAFQVALASGVPWGEYAMGGAFPGQYPVSMRLAAIMQAVLLVLFTAVVLSRAGLILPRWHAVSRRLIWIVVALGAVSLILNLVTPSAGERAVWAPVAFVLLACSIIIAFSKAGPK